MYLHNIKISNKAFTLIELMVAITIIAILAIAGFTVFSNSQKAARDAGRRLDINNIAKAIEASKDGKGYYTYIGSNYANDFPRGAFDSAQTQQYVIAESVTTPPTPPANPAAWTTAVPAGGVYTQFSNSTLGSGGLSLVAADLLVKGGSVGKVNAWTVCASLETTGQPYCVSSTGR